MAQSNIAIIALRGASMEAPPDTLPAIRKGAEQGASGTFLDVRSSRDGVPVIISDYKLEKISNGKGRVSKLTYEELKKLDAGGWFNSEFAGQKFPSLEQAFETLKPGHEYYLMQHETALDSAYAENIKRLSRDWTSAGGKLTVVVADSNQVSVVRDWGLDSVKVLVMLSEKVTGWVLLQKAEKLGLNGIIPHRKQIDSVLIHEAAQMNLPVIAYFANSEEDMKELVNLGVQGIVTCWPGKLKKILEGG
jgi:glycerophosphoryl diester phosphodiesterase